MASAARRDIEVPKPEGVFGKGKLRRIGQIKILAFIFLVIWILIGLFVLTFIVQGTKRGMFDYVLFGKVPQAQQAPNVEAPKETSLPKIGTINIACAEKALKPESIQKLVGEFDYDITKLSADEKTAFEKCIVEKPKESPSAPPAK